MMRKAAGASVRDDLKEEASSLAGREAGISLHLDLRAPGDPTPAITTALEQCGATGIRLNGRSALAHLESRRLPALLAALEKTGRVRELPPRDLAPEIQLTLSW
jgi:hypothetical protein